MEKQSSSKARAKKEETERKNQSLIQQFKDLEKEWELLQASKIKPRPNYQHRFSTGSNNILDSFDNLLQHSPRGLMSSLQRNKSPFDDGFRVKNCDSAVEEILRDRRAAVMSGKLKGRRLFKAADEVELELNYDDFKQSCSVSDSCLSEEKVVVDEEAAVVEESGGGRRSSGGGRRMRGGGGGCMAAMAWFGFVIFLLTVGVISIRCNGKSVHGYDEFMLVPT